MTLVDNSEAKFPALGLRRSIANSPQAVSIYFNQLVYDLRREGIDITTLSLGEAFFDIPLLIACNLNFFSQVSKVCSLPNVKFVLKMLNVMINIIILIIFSNYHI